MMRHNMGVLILSHGRPDRIDTWTHLLKDGYTGPIRIVIDDEDETGDQYREEFGEDVIRVFSKADVDVDVMDQSTDRKGVVFARNAAHRIAAAEGWDYFCVLDDD